MPFSSFQLRAIMANPPKDFTVEHYKEKLLPYLRDVKGVESLKGKVRSLKKSSTDKASTLAKNKAAVRHAEDESKKLVHPIFNAKRDADEAIAKKERLESEAARHNHVIETIQPTLAQEEDDCAESKLEYDWVNSILEVLKKNDSKDMADRIFGRNSTHDHESYQEFVSVFRIEEIVAMTKETIVSHLRPLHRLGVEGAHGNLSENLHPLRIRLAEVLFPFVVADGDDLSPVTKARNTFNKWKETAEEEDAMLESLMTEPATEEASGSLSTPASRKRTGSEFDFDAYSPEDKMEMVALLTAKKAKKAKKAKEQAIKEQAQAREEHGDDDDDDDAFDDDFAKAAGGDESESGDENN